MNLDHCPEGGPTREPCEYGYRIDDYLGYVWVCVRCGCEDPEEVEPWE